MKTRRLRMKDGGWQARSVLECGSPLPLSAGGTRPVAAQSARGLAQSKTWRNFVAALAFLAMAMAAHSQSYSIDWSTIDGGGGTSTGGSFTLNGTIGQPDAGAMSGGNYSLAGGFWGASQTPPPVGNVIIKVWVVFGEVHLRFTGIPGRIYYVERAHSVTGPWPDRLASITMPIDGVVEFVDTTGLISPKAFYRTSTD